MIIGDKLYYVTSARTIDEYEVHLVQDDDIELHLVGFPKIVASMNVESVAEKVRWFYTYEEAKDFQRLLELKHVEAERKRREIMLLEAMVTSVNLNDVIQNGTPIQSKTIEYKPGIWREAFLYEYKEIRYMVIYEYRDIYFNDKHCIRFSEV